MPGLIALGCTARVESFTADADTGTTHAVFTVERSSIAGSQQAPRAAAFAGFVQLPAFADAPRTLELAGLLPVLPPVGGCTELDTHSNANVPLASFEHLELLEAGDVSIVAGDGTVALAPRAFPTVTDSISGLVYSTRDRAAEPLPAAAAYTVRAAGSVGIGGFAAQATAPAELESVTLGGVPLAEAKLIDPGSPIDVTWGVGVAGDVVYVELATDDGTPASVCAFKDEVGTGTVPAGTLHGLGAGRLSVHRARSVRFEAPDVQQGLLRFDFEIDASLVFEH